MKRRFIPIKNCLVHKETKKDKSFEYIKEKLSSSENKILPILVLRRSEDFYEVLDGNKRLSALASLGKCNNIEAFIAETLGEEIDIDGTKMKATYEGQEGMPLLEADEDTAVDYCTLAKEEDSRGDGLKGKGLRLELRENIHMHWDSNRIVMGKRDFLLLVNAMKKWHR